MGSGIDAAATMGRLRTATATLADLGLPPAEVLQRLDKITAGLDPYIATCIYAEYDPHSDRCQIAVAGHLPPALTPAGGLLELLDLPSGAPSGSAASPSRRPPCPCAPAINWSSTPTAWSKHAATPSTNVSTSFSAYWTATTFPWKKPATGSWKHCVIRTTTTMFPYSSPDPDRGPDSLRTSAGRGQLFVCSPRRSSAVRTSTPASPRRLSPSSSL